MVALAQPPPMALPILTLLIFASPLLALAANPYCTEKAYFWQPDGTSKPGGADWSSGGKTSQFVAGPCVGVSGIGMTETFQKTVLIIDRAAASNGYLHLQGRPDDLAYAQELDLVSQRQRPLDVITNTFCSSGQFSPDGTFLSIGGDWSPDYAGPGEFSIRALTPCTDRTCGFRIIAQLARSRWYPTTALLGDGRVMIVGGSSKGVGLNSVPHNVPFVEYHPRPKGTDATRMGFLDDALPYNLFPFVHLLPSGRVFIFASHQWLLWDSLKNAPAPGSFPPINAKDAKGSPLRFSYPTAGTSALFPLSSANGYAAEVMVCGGSAVGSIYWEEEPSDANPGGKVADSADYPAHNRCFLIKPEAADPAWAQEQMQLPRVMPVGVLLPDGHFVVLSGTQTGHSGLGKLAHKPALTPEMYNTATHAWYPEALATSRIPRAYHSSAVLAHDGTVFITGSNPNSNIVNGGGDFPTEFRTEFFHPPYLMPGVPRPVLTKAPQEVTYGDKFDLGFKFPEVAKKVEVVLAHPGFSTHGGNHGMRNVVLDVVGVKNTGTTHVATAAVPWNRNVLPPTWYWLFVVVNGSPNGEGQYVFVKA